MVLVLTLTALFAAAVAAGARTQVRAGRDGQGRPRLSGPERAAIASTSISAVAISSFGLVVTATFKGDIERYLGQRGLAHGAVALVPEPPSAGGLADGGGGFTIVRVPLVQRSRGHLTLHEATVEKFAPERVLRVGAAASATVIRFRNHVFFYLPGAPLGGAARLTLKTFVSTPALSGRSQTGSAWRALLGGRGSEAVSAPVRTLGCSGYPALGASVTAAISSILGPELRRVDTLRLRLTETISAYQAIVAHRPEPRVAKSTLRAYLDSASLRARRLNSEIETLQTLARELDAAGTACAAPPATPTPAPPSPAPQAPAPPPPPPPPPPSPPVTVVQTNPAQSQFMAAQPALPLASSPPTGVPVIDVNDQVRYQHFTGLGAAMTDSSAWLIANKLTAANRLALMQDLFGAGAAPTALGAPPIHLGFLRVGIGATGAMTVTPAYSYDDNGSQPDPTLANFSIAHDQAYIIPTLQQALTINPQLQIAASPWSPPAWMKSNGSLANVGASGSLLPSDYGTYANYIVKFIQAYESAGIPVNAITAANEPTSGGGGTQYPGLNLPEANEAQFIAQDLQPALSTAGLGTKIYGNDLSWDQFSPYASPLAADPAAGPDLAGVAWHCYFGSPTVMSQLQQQAPGLDQIVDECSPEIRSFGTPEFLISTLRNWASVDAIWSVALDPNGQPIQPGNHCGGCRGAVSIDQTTGAVTFLPEYYELGQVSAFVQSGASRIDAPNFVTYGVNASNIETITSGLDDVAFLNPDGSKVLVAYNNSTAPISFGVTSSSGSFTYTIPAQAMTTFVWA